MQFKNWSNTTKTTEYWIDNFLLDPRHIFEKYIAFVEVFGPYKQKCGNKCFVSGIYFKYTF